jgi:hypothetical protein
MYAIQQQHIDEAKGVSRSDNVAGARAARNRSASDASASFGSSPPKFENLEEAARRLAQERLAKLHDEHAEYRQYYVAQQPQSPTTRSKLSKTLSMRNRRRTNSYEEDSDDSDVEQSRKIRSQMSLFTSKLAEVDGKKRQADRDALLAAAHRNVTKQMNAMDEKVFSDTGKASPQQRELWERQARERAQRDSDERMVNVGKVHIGGGKFMDQSEIDTIAKTRLQPTLDDITEKAEAQRARDEELRLEQERQKAEAEREKQRQAEIKQGLKETKRKHLQIIASNIPLTVFAEKEKAEEQARKAEEKRVQKEEATAAKEKRNAEAAEAKEKARVEKEERQRAKEEENKDKKPSRFGGFIGKTGTVAAGAAVGAAGVVAGAATSAVDKIRPGTADSGKGEGLRDDEPGSPVSPESPASPQVARDDQVSPEPSSPEAGREQVPASPTPDAPESPKDSRMRSWFKTRFRSASKTQKDEDFPKAADEAEPAVATEAAEDTDARRSDSMRDVALAGRTETNRETDDMYGTEPVSPVKPDAEVTRDRSPSISSVSSYGDAKAEQIKTASREPQPEPEPAAPAETDPGVEKPSSPSPEASRVSTEQPASESEGEGQGRGRRGFRARLLGKVRSVRDKNRNTGKGSETINEEPTVEQQAAAMPDATPFASETNKDTDDADKGVANDETNQVEKHDSGLADGVTTNDKFDEPNADDTLKVDTTAKENGKATPEEVEEARDSFIEEKLAPPPKLSSVTSGGGSPKGSRERSRFTEDL